MIEFIIIIFGFLSILFLIYYSIKSRIFYYISLASIVLSLIILSQPKDPYPDSMSRVGSIKSNMHSFQTVIETYAVDWSGQYPDNVEILFKEANERQYWKNFKNPFGTNYKAYNNLPNIKKPFTLESNIFISGTLYYQPIIEDKEITKYFIYGANKANKLIFDRKINDFFTLTNQ